MQRTQGHTIYKLRIDIFITYRYTKENLADGRCVNDNLFLLISNRIAHDETALELLVLRVVFLSCGQE